MNYLLIILALIIFVGSIIRLSISEGTKQMPKPDYPNISVGLTQNNSGGLNASGFIPSTQMANPINFGQ